jgi:hypothetical protein
MPIRADWYDDTRKIIHLEFEGRLTWDDLYKATESSLRLHDEAQGKVHTIIDVVKVTSTPNLNVSAMQRVIRAGVGKHPNKGVSVITGARPLVRTVFSVFERLYPTAMKGYRYAETVEAALAMLEKEPTTSQPA